MRRWLVLSFGLILLLRSILAYGDGSAVTSLLRFSFSLGPLLSGVLAKGTSSFIVSSSAAAFVSMCVLGDSE